VVDESDESTKDNDAMGESSKRKSYVLYILVSETTSYCRNHTKITRILTLYTTQQKQQNTAKNT